MKKRTDGESNQNENTKNINAKLWIRILSVILGVAMVAVACLGVALFVSYDKIEDLNATNTNLEALVAELVAGLGSVNEELKQSNEQQESLKNSLAALQEQLTTLENTNQAAQSEIDALKKQLEEYYWAPEDRIRIYIDQGHNPTSYHNSGAYGNGLYEQDVTFLIGNLLAELLKADGRFEVQVSRPNKSVVLGTDGKSSIMARIEGAIAFEADYLISLHTNSYTTDAPNGVEVWYDEDSRESYVFGETLLDGMVESTKLKRRGMHSDSDLDILEYSPMPAVIVEMGFISNRNDAALFAEHPELFAQGIYNGILHYFGLLPKTHAEQ